MLDFTADQSLSYLQLMTIQHRCFENPRMMLTGWKVVPDGVACADFETLLLFIYAPRP